MAETLIIVDSAAKKEFIEGYYSGSVEVYISIDAVAQPLYKGADGAGGAGVDESEFSFSVSATGRETADKLEAYRDKNIIVALDADPRSEYLCWMISAYVNQSTKGANKVKRLVLSGVRDAEAREAFDFVGLVDARRGLFFYIRGLFDAFLSRHLQRLIGTSRGPGNFPLQYSTLTTIFLLADRQLQIQMVRPSGKWQVKAELSLQGHFFEARLEEVFEQSNDGFFKDQQKALRFVDLIKEDPFVVEKVERTPLAIQPPMPYMLTELLHDALVLHDLSPKEVWGCLRKLFHGLPVAGKIVGLVSSYASLENANTGGWLKDIRAEVTSLYGQDGLGDGVLEPVTGMIFPLIPKLTSKQVEALEESDGFIYEMIRRRALASQMKAALGETIRVEISAGPDAYFTTQFNVLLEKGFLDQYQGQYAGSSLMAESPFAAICEEQVLNLIHLAPEPVGSSPAEYYTLETLFADLAEFKVMPGPVSVGMIQGMIKAGYILLDKGGYLKPGENIKKVIAILNKAFPYMQGINLSAYIEQTVNEVISGRKGLNFALKQFDQTLMAQGRSLVKVKIPTTFQPRSRRTSTIIKQVDEGVVGAHVAEKKPAGAEPTPVETVVGSPPGVSVPVVSGDEGSLGGQSVENQASSVESPTVESGGVGSGGEDVGGDEVSVEPDGNSQAPDASLTAPELDAEPTKESPIVVESMEESAFLSEGEDAWPDELKKAFEEALQESEATTQEPLPTEIGDRASALLAERVVTTDQERACQVCGKPMFLKEDRFGKFWSCSGFPACRQTEVFGQDAQAMYCPICREGQVSFKRTPSGKTLYVCTDQECEFMSWSKPHFVHCQLCDSPYLVEKTGASGAMTLRCPKAGCDFSQALGGGVVAEEQAVKPTKRKVLVRRKAGSAALGSGGGGTKKVRVVRRKK